MSRNICIVQDFLTVNHRMKIRETAASVDFVPHFFSTAELDAAKEVLQNSEILYAQSVELAKAAPASLKWYALSSAGADLYCVEPSPLASPDCILTSANVYGVTIAEHVVMVTLMLLRRVPDYQEALRRHEWPAPKLVRSIRDGKFTVLGTGNIGQNVAERLRGMGAAAVQGVSRSGRPAEGFDDTAPISELDDVLKRTEFLICALPGTPETTGLLDARRLALLPKGAYLVNVGRGSLIDQPALKAALESGQIAGAALDVCTPEPLPADDPLWDAPNLILTSHVSGNLTLGYTCDENVRLFCDNLIRYAAGEPLRGVVDRKRGY